MSIRTRTPGDRRLTARVGYEGAHTVQIVDPVGRLSRARQIDHRIQLEQAQ